jgi:transmembrane sensor
MKPRHPPDEPLRSSEPGAEPSTELQAAEWLIRLQDSDPDPEEPYPDLLERHAAFTDWLHDTPAHLAAFREVLALSERAHDVDQRRLIDIQALVEKHATALAAAKVQPPAYPTSASGSFVTPTLPAAAARSHKVVVIAAVFAVALLVLAVRHTFFGTDSYETNIGEQLEQQLRDGSVIFLNTNSRVEVYFSRRSREVRLIRGEALFTVQPDPDRAFAVDAGAAAVVALGTEFGVRRQDKSTDVVVVTGKVRVSATGNEGRKAADSAAVRSGVTVIGAGESVQIAGGTVTKGTENVADALAWRQKQLVFRDKPLADIATEFNRYNRSQIRVEGDAARATRITGVFDSRDLQRVLLIARNHEALLVEPEGKNWVIRSR